jgi:hypothetical protein
MDPALQIAELAARSAHLEAELHRANNAGAQLQAAKIAADAKIASLLASKERSLPKIPSPKPFTGVTGPAVEEFMNAVEKQYAYYGEQFAEESLKLSYASNYLVEKAAAWLKALSTENTLAGTPITTWEDLKAALRERFQPIGSSTVARQSLDGYVQKGSVANYVEHFYKCLTYITDMSDSDQVHQFCRGLKKEIKHEVVREEPKTIHDAVNIAVKAESYLGMSSQYSFISSGSRFPSRFGSSSSSGAAASSSSSAMDVNSVDALIDEFDGMGPRQETSRETSSSAREHQLMAQIASMHAQQKMSSSLLAMFGDRNKSAGYERRGDHRSSISSSTPRVPGVSKEDYARCRAENRCLKCREVGHVARECKKPQRSNW